MIKTRLIWTERRIGKQGTGVWGTSCLQGKARAIPLVDFEPDKYRVTIQLDDGTKVGPAHKNSFSTLDSAQYFAERLLLGPAKKAEKSEKTEKAEPPRVPFLWFADITTRLAALEKTLEPEPKPTGCVYGNAILFTTLRQILEKGPCGTEPNTDGSLEGWLKLLYYLGKTEADDEPLSLLAILAANGLDDALWALRSVDGYDREIRLLACDFAEHVLPTWEAQYSNDNRPRTCIETARRFADGEATREELTAAAAAAWDAGWSTIRDAAGDICWAVRSTARDAASAAGAAAWDAAWGAGGAAERTWQVAHFRRWLGETGKGAGYTP